MELRHKPVQVFVRTPLKRAPESLGQRIKAIAGVEQVETRVMVPVRLDMPDFAEPVTGLMVSVSESGRQGLNGLHLRQGRLPAPSRPDEVVVSAPFAQAQSQLLERLDLEPFQECFDVLAK